MRTTHAISNAAAKLAAVDIGGITLRSSSVQRVTARRTRKQLRGANVNTRRESWPRIRTHRFKIVCQIRLEGSLPACVLVLKSGAFGAPLTVPQMHVSVICTHEHRRAGTRPSGFGTFSPHPRRKTL